MIEALKGVLDLFRQGSVVADPKLWKDRAAATVGVAGVMLAVLHILQAFGVDVPLTAQDVDSLAGGLVIVVLLVAHYTTSDKVGLLPPKAPDVPPAPEADVRAGPPGEQ